MLILQRRRGESITINENITLTVLESGTDWVKLAIDAPREIPILRSELKEIARENKMASETLPLEVLNKLMDKSTKDSAAD